MASATNFRVEFLEAASSANIERLKAIRSVVGGGEGKFRELCRIVLQRPLIASLCSPKPDFEVLVALAGGNIENLIEIKGGFREEERFLRICRRSLKRPLIAPTSPPDNLEIVEAAASGNIERLRVIRDEFGDDDGHFWRICAVQSDITSGLTVLHAAAGMGQLETCRFLVDEVGVYVDVKTHNGETPLLLAIKNHHVNVAQYLMQRDASVTTIGSRGFTALHSAILNEDIGTMNLLLEKVADIEADSVRGTPLHFAAKSGSTRIVKYLLENQAKSNSFSIYLGISPLISAIYSDSNAFECVELLLEAKADPHVYGNGLTPLAHAIGKKADIRIIKALVDAGVDVDRISLCGFNIAEEALFVKDNDALDSYLLKRRPRIRKTDPSRSPEALKRRRNKYIRNLERNANNELNQNDYTAAISSYTEAIHYKPNDARLYANRSMCWARMGKGVFALHDAEACVRLRPDWGTAHLREAMAWHLLERNRLSRRSFRRVYERDPESEDI